MALRTYHPTSSSTHLATNSSREVNDGATLATHRHPDAQPHEATLTRKRYGLRSHVEPLALLYIDELSTTLPRIRHCLRRNHPKASTCSISSGQSS